MWDWLILHIEHWWWKCPLHSVFYWGQSLARLSLKQHCQAQFPFSLFLPLPPQHHILLNNFSTIYLKMNNKRLRLKKLHLGNLRLRKPLLLLLLLWKRRPSLLSLPSQQSRLWWVICPPCHLLGLVGATFCYGECACCISAILSTVILHGLFPQCLAVSHSMPLQHVFLSALKCHSSYIWHIRLKFGWVVVVSQVVWCLMNFRRGKNLCHF